MKKVGIIDYGVGNLKSVANALLEIGVSPIVSADSESLLSCSHVILPGVGAFQHGMEALRARKLDLVVQQVAARGTPILGICLGMQMLMEFSSEFGRSAGLGLIPGEVRRFTRPEAAIASDEVLRLPNVGWLSIKASNNINGLARRLLDGMSDDAKFYFIHSYCADSSGPAVAATSSYQGIDFSAVISQGNIAGTQFHPEKSGVHGLSMLRNFVD
jgi:imidazole glycerol-phosphate synthase subunit HisH